MCWTSTYHSTLLKVNCLSNPDILSNGVPWRILFTFIDGVSLGNLEKAGGGRFICDYRGEWLKGFSRGIGSTLLTVSDDGANIHWCMTNT